MSLFEIDPDIKKARTLSSDFYTDAAYFEASKEKIFARAWQFLGRADEIESVTAEVLDPNLYYRMAMSKRGGMPRGKLPAGANLKNDKDWCKLVGCEEDPKPIAPPPVVKIIKLEPPKPRAVIDVFRGDKHVQETFHD